MPTSDSQPVPLSSPRRAEGEASRIENRRRWQRGLFWALLSPLFLGTVPILAKLAYAANVNVLTVVAFRTLFAAGMLWGAVLLFRRQLARSSWPAVLSSLFAGAINGIGSLFFYSSLTRIDASLGQLINVTYLLFVTLLLRLAGQAVSLLTLLRTGLAILGIYILTQGGLGTPDWLGVGMMAVAALMYAIQLVLSQRILYDVPAPTMALYAMTAMAAVVTIAWFTNPTDVTTIATAGWRAILAMGIVTGLSRLTLFLGVKHLGSMQTALLGVLEVVVSIVLAILFLGERFTLLQWLGALVLLVSILLVRFERNVPRFVDWWKFFWRLRTRR
ncbi:MAG: DMT family transporter [Anaerolineales bacterium]|nr:DMT family transporter [Anaerolineales bacterium]